MPWLLKLYPQILSNEKQVFLMSMDKFLLRNDPIVDKSYFVYKKLAKDVIIFIDEFDATKETVLRRLIDNATDSRIDYAITYKMIHDRLEQGNFPVTLTNPSENTLQRYKEGRLRKKLEDVIDEINSLVDGPISGEIKATTTKWEDMVAEGKVIASYNKNMVVKIPMTKDGLIAVKELTKLGIKTNVTLIFSVNQALLAAKAGATFVSPFVGRLDDISEDGIALIYDIVDVFTNYDIETEIIAASIRHPMHVVECAKAGADIATIPYKVLMQMIKHPLTDNGIEKFINEYKKVFG